MRYASMAACVVAFVIVLTIALVSYRADASGGNVLLPPGSGTSDSSGQPNLGIAAPDTSSSSPSIQPPSQASSTPPTADQKAPPPSSPPASSTPAPPTPPKSYVSSPVSPQAAAKLPVGSVPTHIIHVPDTAAALGPQAKNLPYGLTFGFSNRSIFGANDVQEIGDKLGLSPSQISNSCVLSMRGYIRTSKMSYPVYGGNASQFQVRYDGLIQGYLLGAVASCQVDMNRLPPGSGYLTESGGRIIISLQPIQCDPPNRQVTGLTIIYNGTTQNQCMYN